MRLVIVESPAKSKTISQYLGREYAVRASVGHIRDLPKSNKNAIDIAGGFVPRYEITKGKEKVINGLRAAAQRADEVLLATDPDREGEAIAWHVAQALGLANPRRVVFYEITKQAVQDAIAHPRPIDQNLRRAQEARRVLDRLVGYDLSGLIWKKVRYGLSAGRVQSPALRILLERERDIRAFIPQDYWVIAADTLTSGKKPLMLACAEEPDTEQKTEAILSYGKKNPWSVKEVSENAAERRARAPFTTSTLQQAASSRLGFSPSRTMALAQKLYEEGHITYMRTDSTAVSAAAQKNILAIVEKRYGKPYVRAQTYKTKSKNAQEAHEAIRPTDAAMTDAGTHDDQKKLYRLIWQRTVASQMAPARIMKTKITAVVGDSAAVPDFSALGSRTVFDGWLKADPHAKGEEIELPQVSIGETLTLVDIRSEHKQTQAPPRYSEAGLIKELEKRGIGRPSTYAATVKTLYERGYVAREGKSMRPTDTGEVVSTFLEENFAPYISDSFTAEMENELDQIAEGKRGYEKTLSDFYGPFSRDVAAKRDMPRLTTLGPAPKEITCPLCDAVMVVKLGKNGKFFSCSRFPSCSGMRSLDGAVREGPKETGEACPECADGKLVEREGKYGTFTACDKYPKCTYVKKDENAQSGGEQTTVACPLCATGVLVGRRGRFGVFYSCSTYPKCAYAIKAKPTGAFCSLCNALMMEGTKTIPERCSNKECPNHNPQKAQE